MEEDMLDAYSGMINKENIEKLNEKPKKVSLKEILEGNVPEGSIVEIEDFVYRIFNPRRFEKEGRERFVRTVIIGSLENSIRVVFWDKNSILADTIPLERDDRIRISNLLLRKGLTELELSTKNNTIITKVSSANTGIWDFSSLSIGEKDVDILAKIVEIGTPKYFNDQNNKQRKVVRCVLTDGLTNINAAFWDSSCDYVNSLHPGDFIKIEFASIKENNGIEINAGNFSRVVANRIFKSRMKNLV